MFMMAEGLVFNCEAAASGPELNLFPEIRAGVFRI
jgi:hypothetical protein